MGPRPRQVPPFAKGLVALAASGTSDRSLPETGRPLIGQPSAVARIFNEKFQSREVHLKKDCSSLDLSRRSDVGPRFSLSFYIIPPTPSPHTPLPSVPLLFRAEVLALKAAKAKEASNVGGWRLVLASISVTEVKLSHESASVVIRLSNLAQPSPP